MRVRRAIVIAVGIGLSQCSSEDTREEDVVVGLPCTPSLEKDPLFTDFQITEATLEARAPECGGGVCMVNHFQGRVSCPLGQPEALDPNGQVGCVPAMDPAGHAVEGQGSCLAGDVCREVRLLSPPCDPGQEGDLTCQVHGAGAKCNAEGSCECASDVDCPSTELSRVRCDPATRRCVAYACQRPNACQEQGRPASDNAGKTCCLPGTDMPSLLPVCGQCIGSDGEGSTRQAEATVYCTCRCGVADGEPDEPGFDFCSCPEGFECSEIRPYTGVGDRTLTGKFCIKVGTAYRPAEDQCGLVHGHWASGWIDCAGSPTKQCRTESGPCED